MRARLVLLLLAACAHGPLLDRGDPGPSTPLPAVTEDCAAAVSAAAAIAAPYDRAVTVLAFLCEDQSRVECPPCPQGANCAACLPRAWLFCDAPAAADLAHALWVLDPPPNLALTVGNRYLLRGTRTVWLELTSAPCVFTTARTGPFSSIPQAPWPRWGATPLLCDETDADGSAIVEKHQGATRFHDDGLGCGYDNVGSAVRSCAVGALG
jgi:hypothetical protein